MRSQHCGKHPPAIRALPSTLAGRSKRQGCKREIALRATIRSVTMPSPQRPARSTAQTHRRPSTWVAISADVLGIASLTLVTVALTRSPANPSYSGADRGAAASKLCDRFKPAANAMHIGTHGPPSGLRRAAILNGTLTLQNAATNPALDPKYRHAAQEAILVYHNLFVVPLGETSGCPQFDSVVDTANVKHRTLKELCGG